MDLHARHRAVIARAPAALLGALALAVTGSATARAAAVGGVGAFPAPVRGQAEPAPYFKLDLRPGQTRTVSAIIVNSSARPIPVAVAPVAGLTGQTSGAVYGNAAETADAGMRLQPSVSSLVLAARSRRRVPMRVTVEPSARPGDHLMGLAIVDRHHPTSGGRFSVTEVVRVVLGVSVRVPGPVLAGLRIGHVSAEALGGTPDAALQVPIHNVGGVYCRPQLAVRLAGEGRTIDQVRHLDTLLPGSTIAFPLPWHHPLARGDYAARVTATGCGPVQRATQALVVNTSRPAAQPGAPLAAPAPASVPAQHGSGVSWLWLALVGSGGLIIGLFATRRRGRTPSDGAPPTVVGSLAPESAAADA